RIAGERWRYGRTGVRFWPLGGRAALHIMSTQRALPLRRSEGGPPSSHPGRNLTMKRWLPLVGLLGLLPLAAPAAAAQPDACKLVKPAEYQQVLHKPVGLAPAPGGEASPAPLPGPPPPLPTLLPSP